MFTEYEFLLRNDHGFVHVVFRFIYYYFITVTCINQKLFSNSLG